MRASVFHGRLVDWSERACSLTVNVASSAGEIHYTGILRPYFSVRSLRGWTLVPPIQHGGFDHQQLVPLDFEQMRVREVIVRDGAEVLRFWRTPEMRFTLRLDPAGLTPPPRRVEPKGRYLYRGGRERPRAERWMLE